MHFKPEEIPLITPETPGGGCMRSIKAGEMEIGFTWMRLLVAVSPSLMRAPARAEGPCRALPTRWSSAR